MKKKERKEKKTTNPFGRRHRCNMKTWNDICAGGGGGRYHKNVNDVVVVAARRRDETGRA